MELFASCVRNGRMAIIGMIHVRALPGTPRSRYSVQKIVDIAQAEAEIYAKHGIDGICIENMFDIPYVKSSESGPEITAVMARISNEVRRIVPRSIPCGIQILAGQNKEALAVACAADLQFIRVEGFVFSHVADEGWIDACAGSLLRYRKSINAERIAILTDIKKKHSSHSVTADLDIVEVAKAARFFLSDGLILTGKETGDNPDHEQVRRVRKCIPPDTPVIVGSGITEQNVKQYFSAGVNAVIVGSTFKRDGVWSNEICQERLAKFIETANHDHDL